MFLQVIKAITIIQESDEGSDRMASSSSAVDSFNQTGATGENRVSANIITVEPETQVRIVRTKWLLARKTLIYVAVVGTERE